MLLVLLGLFVAGFLLVGAPPIARHVLAGVVLLVAAIFATGVAAAQQPEPVKAGPFRMRMDPPTGGSLAERPLDVPH